MEMLSGMPWWGEMLVGAGIGVVVAMLSCRRDPDRWTDVAVVVVCAIALAGYAATKWDRATGTGWWATPGDAGRIAKLTARGREGPYLARRQRWLAMTDGERARWRVSIGALVGVPCAASSVPTVLYLTRTRRKRGPAADGDSPDEMRRRPGSDVFPQG